jgi:hypothetical protein
MDDSFDSDFQRFMRPHVVRAAAIKKEMVFHAEVSEPYTFTN